MLVGHQRVVLDKPRKRLDDQLFALTHVAEYLAPGPAAAETALRLLGLDVPRELAGERPGRLWQWALPHWNIETLRGRRELRPPVQHR
jgi:hypothetical protein